MRGSEHQPWQHLLPATAGAGSRSRDHAASRSAAPGVPLRRLANAERPAGCRGVQDRPPACENVDAAHGDRGALSPSTHHDARARAQKIYPYLLRGMEITRPNQVWAMDITYIPMARGFVYLAVVLDWFSRRALSWRLLVTTEAAFFVETLQDGMAPPRPPAGFNTDHGPQFSRAAFTRKPIHPQNAISHAGQR